jgi:hypothetical protein
MQAAVGDMLQLKEAGGSFRKVRGRYCVVIGGEISDGLARGREPPHSTAIANMTFDTRDTSASYMPLMPLFGCG